MNIFNKPDFFFQKNRESYKLTIYIAYAMAGFAQLCELLFFYIFYREVSVEQSGYYSLAVAISMFFSVTITLGIEPILIRKFGRAELRLKQVVPAIIIIRVPIIIMSTFILQVVYWLHYLSYESYLVIGLLGALQVFVTTESIFSSWLRAHHQQKIVNIISGLGSFGKLIIGFIIIVLFSNTSLVLIISGMIAIRLLSLIVLAFLAYKSADGDKSLQMTDLKIREIAWLLFLNGLIFAGINLLTVAQNRLDWILVSSLISTVALASYAIANKLYEIFQLVIGVFLTTTYPWLCQDNTIGGLNPRLSFLLRGLIAAGTMTALLGMLVLPGFIQLLFKDKYLGVESLIRILMLSASLITASGVFYSILVSKGREKKILRITTITTGLQFGLNLFLIPRIAANGAAVGMLSLTITTLIGLSVLTIKESILPPSIVYRIIVFLATLPLFAIFLANLEVSIWISVTILVIIGIIISWYILLEVKEKKLVHTYVKSNIIARRNRDA